MDDLDTGEFDLSFTELDGPDLPEHTPAISVDVVDEDAPDLDEGDFVFVGWQDGF